MANKSGKKCEYCGISTGRGKRHKPGCGRPNQQGRASAKSSVAFSMNMLKGYPVQDLLAIRDKLDGLIKSKDSELAEQIKTLQEALKEIRRK